MAEELYPGASFAAPFMAASAYAPLSQIPTNILQSMQAARQQARADEALQLQQDQFAFNRQTALRKQGIEDVDRELSGQTYPPDGGTTSRRRRDGGYGGTRSGTQARIDWESDRRDEEAVVGGVPTREEWMGLAGDEGAARRRLFTEQQGALGGAAAAGYIQEAPFSEVEFVAEEPLSPGPIRGRQDVTVAPGGDQGRKYGGPMDEGPSSTVSALLGIVERERRSARAEGAEQAFYSLEDLADLLVSEEAKLIEQGHADVPDDVMASVAEELWRSGPAPPEDAGRISREAQRYLEDYDPEGILSEAEAVATLQEAGFHPEEAAAVVSRVRQIAPAYRSDQVLSELGLLQPGQRALTEADMDENPATRVNLPSDYSRTPDQFAHQLYRTEWGRGLDSAEKAQLLADYRGWYKDRVSERRLAVMGALDADRDARQAAAEVAFEARIQSFIDQGGAGAARREIRNDEAALRRWAVSQAMNDPAHRALVAQFSGEKNARIAAGPRWAEHERQERKDARDRDVQESRVQAGYNERLEGLLTDPVNAALVEKYGIDVVDRSGNYRPADEIVWDLRTAAAGVGGEGADVSSLFADVPLGEGDSEAITALQTAITSAQVESEARRAEARPKAQGTDDEGATLNQRLRIAGKRTSIHTAAYKEALRNSEVSPRLWSDLDAAATDMAHGNTPRVRAEAKVRHTEILARIDEVGGDVEYGSIELLNPARVQEFGDLDALEGNPRGTHLAARGGAPVDGGGGEVVYRETTKGGKKYRVPYLNGEQHGDPELVE